MSESFIKQLQNTSSSIQPKPVHWIGDYPDGDNALSYCHDCCYKNINLLLNGFQPIQDGESEPTPLSNKEKDLVNLYPPFIDGGFSNENDFPPICQSCYTIINSIMTDFCIEEELTHYLSYFKDININDPKEAYLLLNTIESASTKEHKEMVNSLIKNINFHIF
jgi:hypothetical protein